MRGNFNDVRPDYSQALDMSDTIAHECWCGSNLFRLAVSFEAGEIVFYSLDMECAYCGTRYTAPTPLDLEESND